MASADLTSSKMFATLESNGTQRTYLVDDNPPSRFLIVTNVGSNPAVLAEVGATITMDPAAPTQKDGERLLPAGGQARLPRNVKGFVHKAATVNTTILTVEDATE